MLTVRFFAQVEDLLFSPGAFKREAFA